MLKRRHHILTILIFILTAFSVDRGDEKGEFETKVQIFLKGLEKDFEESPERYLGYSKLNDQILETLPSSYWNRTLTLKSKKTFKNHYDQVVKQRLYLGFHDFESEERCHEAFEKVMNCLGGECQKINWGEGNKGVKTTPFFYMKTDRQIVFCKISCEHTNDFWTSFKEQLESEFKTDRYRIIIAGCGGPLTFKERND